MCCTLKCDLSECYQFVAQNTLKMSLKVKCCNSDVPQKEQSVNYGFQPV